jgi:formate hydrogenlyase transcriptional activator
MIESFQHRLSRLDDYKMSPGLPTEANSSVAERYEALFRVSQTLISYRRPEELLSVLDHELHQVVEFHHLGLAIYDQKAHEVCVRTFDRSGTPVFFPKVAAEDTMTWWVYQHQQPLVVPALDEETRFNVGVKILKELGIGSACILPLTTVHRRFGSLVVGRKEADAYGDEEVRFLSLVANQVALALDAALSFEAISDLKDKLAQEKLYLEDEIRSELNSEEIVGTSATLRRALTYVQTVAPTESTVLIYGETGTGKELIARAIHDRSPRGSGAFVKLNCAAIPTGLLESELFGHEKGAFTGAVAQRIGRFELANGGTIFLDEVGEIPLELQPKLLRVLQEREFERLGSARTIRTDARLIAATNRDLAMMVEEGKFRADLFYRLNVFPINVPPLKERPEDIPLLVRRFVQDFSRRMNKRIETIPSETLQALARYHWPGNIRELQNVVERAVILSSGPVLKVPLSELKQPAINRKSSPGKQDRLQGTLEEAERKHILAVLEETHWVVSGPLGAAARLGLKRTTLQYRMAKLGIFRIPRPAPEAFAP